MTLLFFGPIILILILFGVFVTVTRSTGSMLSRKTVMWLVAGYAAILLFAIVFNYSSKFWFQDIRKVAPESEVRTAHDASNSLYNAALHGKVDQLKGAFVKKKWSFNYHAKTLTIAKGYASTYPVFIEKKSTQDGKIEVLNYSTKTMIRKVDVTDLMKPPSVDLNDKTLSIIKPPSVSLSLAGLDSEFTITQFKKNRVPAMVDYDMVIGSNVIYIIVPKDLNVSGTNLQYVD